LNLEVTAIKNFGPTDSVNGYFTVAVTDSNGNPKQVTLDTNSWYYIGAEMPTVGSTIFYMGCDGSSDFYPRTFGRNHFHSYLEYGTPVWPGDRSSSTNNMVSNPGSALAPCPFGGTYNTDSVVFSNERGLVATIPLIVNNHPGTVVDTVNGVKNVSSIYSKFEVYPNPTSDFVNASIQLNSTASIVSYSILDGLGRAINKEVHNNVLNETYTYSTAKLPSGNYFMMVIVDGKSIFRKFTVIR
jgi:hypothetical protein